MNEAMFCYQCEQTAGGKGCTKKGVCGKDAKVSALQDLLIYELKGIGFYGWKLIEKGGNPGIDACTFVIDALFSTLTNVNFDPERFVELLKSADCIKNELGGKIGRISRTIPESALYELPLTIEQMIADAAKTGIMACQDIDPDILSLRGILVYGLKGMAAYAHHAYVLGLKDEEVNNFFFKGLNAVIDDTVTVGEFINLIMEFGRINLRCMELLDRANTGTYGHPVPVHVPVTRKKGPFIIVSGHDLKDLKELLEQTEGMGINIYTHGEMLPSHAYPELKRHRHLIGNYGGAWQNQQKEFDGIPGCILMTTNCLQKPGDSYKDRIFTTGMTGWPDVKHIEEKDGRKNFGPVVKKSLELGGWAEDEDERTILVGFGHNTVLSNANKITAAVKNGHIRHFFLIGGCDGAKPGRNYYTEFAEKTPKDTVIMTLACGKYRFNKIDFGYIGELPRLMDVGQCNDAYSAVKIALALSEAFGCDVNDLPLSLILSWYEQKAVCILLTLLSLGLKNIRIGPSLPAFISPNVLKVLADRFNLMPITNPDDDLKAIAMKMRL